MSLGDLVQLYINEGYNYIDAAAKVSQDVILLKISKSSFSKNVTIKGGVVMHNISKDMRRATRDIDFDFIKYSLDDDSIENFIKKLNNVKDGVKIEIISKIEKLHHQDYDGKRVIVSLTDSENYKIYTKLDIGVHKDFDIKQEEYCFDFNVIKESVTLFINSKEQIFAEKLKSLLKFSYASTRYKDIFDFYYLINNCNIDKNKLKIYIQKIIINDNEMKIKNFKEIILELDSIFENEKFISNLNNVKVNWLNLPSTELIKYILNYLKTL